MTGAGSPWMLHSNTASFPTPATTLFKNCWNFGDVVPTVDKVCKLWPAAILEHWNDHISATEHPIHFMSASSLGFLGSDDRMALFPVRSNPRCRPWHAVTWCRFAKLLWPLYYSSLIVYYRVTVAVIQCKYQLYSLTFLRERHLRLSGHASRSLGMVITVHLFYLYTW